MPCACGPQDEVNARKNNAGEDLLPEHKLPPPPAKDPVIELEEVLAAQAVGDQGTAGVDPSQQGGAANDGCASPSSRGANDDSAVAVAEQQDRAGAASPAQQHAARDAATAAALVGSVHRKRGTARAQGAAGAGGGGDGAAAAGTSGSEADDGFNSLLMMNAEHVGNVARFINHSCNGNLTKQVRGLLKM